MPETANVYLIKDLSRLSGHSVHTLKFYLKLGLIKESGRSPETRFRYFSDRTLNQLAQIRVWRKQHKSLADIAALQSSEDVSIEAQHFPFPVPGFQAPSSAAA